jgi:hypothetical protein
MPDINVSALSLDISGPAAITVKVDPGLEGARGSYIFPNPGKPYNQSVFVGSDQNFVEPQLYDWCINLKTDDDEYMMAYNYRPSSEGFEWVKMFRLVPNIYHSTLDGSNKLTFTSGATSHTYVVSSKTFIAEQQYGVDESGVALKDIPASASFVNNQAAMLALTGKSVGDYAFQKDKNQFFKLTSLPTSILSNWEEGVKINISLDIENQYPVVTSFEFSASPTSSIVGENKTYSFPLTITAVEANPISGFIPLTTSGHIATHISLNMI